MKVIVLILLLILNFNGEINYDNRNDYSNQYRFKETIPFELDSLCTWNNTHIFSVHLEGNFLKIISTPSCELTFDYALIKDTVLIYWPPRLDCNNMKLFKILNDSALIPCQKGDLFARYFFNYDLKQFNALYTNDKYVNIINDTLGEIFPRYLSFRGCY